MKISPVGHARLWSRCTHYRQIVGSAGFLGRAIDVNYNQSALMVHKLI